MRALLLSALLLCSSSWAMADEVDDYVAREMAQQKIPGLSLAIVRDGQIVKARGYGLASVELNVPATERTVYQSGSVGKQFTAGAVMLLVEEGKLGLDDRISKYIAGTPDTWKAITIRHLLTHTSGIKDYTDGSVMNLRRDYTDDELIKLTEDPHLEFMPGEKYEYSNSGYLLLGMIVSRVSGKFYGDFLHDRVFGPLGMDTIRVMNEADIIPNRAAGYQLIKGEWKNQTYVAPTINTTGDGSLYLTVLDLAKWDLALTERRLFKASSYEAMWTPVTLNDGTTYPYGFGWRLEPTNGHRTISHSGAWQGFLSNISRFVDDRLTVIVLVNTDTAETGAIAQGVAGLLVPALRTKH